MRLNGRGIGTAFGIGKHSRIATLIITSLPTIEIPENTTAVGQLTCNMEGATFAKYGSGANNGLFTVSESGLVTITAQSFETLNGAWGYNRLDDGTIEMNDLYPELVDGPGNAYELSVRATLDGQTADQTIIVCVADGLLAYKPMMAACYFRDGFSGANILDSSGNNRHALSRNTGSILGDGTMYFAVTGLLTTDTITCASTNQATCGTNGRLNIANGHVVWGITVTRSGAIWAYYPVTEKVGLVLHDVSGNGRHGVMTTGSDARWQVVDLPTQNYLRDNGGSRVVYFDGTLKLGGTYGILKAASTDNIRLEFTYKCDTWAASNYLLGGDGQVYKVNATTFRWRMNGTNYADFTVPAVPDKATIVLTHNGLGVYKLLLNGVEYTAPMNTAQALLDIYYIGYNGSTPMKGYIRDFKFTKNGTVIFDISDLYTGYDNVSDGTSLITTDAGTRNFKMIPKLQSGSTDADGFTLTHPQNGHQAIPGTYFSLPTDFDLLAAGNLVTINDYYDGADVPNIIHAGSIGSYEPGIQYYDYKDRDSLVIIQSDAITLTSEQNIYIREVIGNWIDLIIADFLSTNNHFSTANQTYYSDWLKILFGKLYVDSAGTGYYYNTFGPEGQNREKATFFLLTFQEGNLPAGKVFQKTGATLRHNVGGTVTNSNNTPAHTYDAAKPYWLISSTDGFSGLSAANYGTCNLVKEIPSLLYTNVLGLNFSVNNLTSDISDYNYKPLVVKSITYSSTLISGVMKNIPLHVDATSLLASTSYVSGCNLTTFGTKITDINLNNSALTTANINSLVANLNSWYATHAPTVNLALTLNGFPNGYLTGGASNSDLVALVAIYTAAGKTLTPLYNTDEGALSEACVVITTDDSYLSTLNNMADLVVEYGFVPTNYITASFATTPYTYPSGIYTALGRTINWAEVAAFAALGNDMQCHGNTHGITMPNAGANLIAANNTWIANGLPAPRHSAYPSGSYSDAVIADINTIRDTGRTVDLGFNGANTNHWKLKCFTLDTSYWNPITQGVEKVKKAIDVAKAGNYALILLVHGLPLISDPDFISHSQLEELLQYCQTVGMPIKSISQLYADEYS